MCDSTNPDPENPGTLAQCDAMAFGPSAGQPEVAPVSDESSLIAFLGENGVLASLSYVDTFDSGLGLPPSDALFQPMVNGPSPMGDRGPFQPSRDEFQGQAHDPVMSNMASFQLSQNEFQGQAQKPAHNPVKNEMAPFQPLQDEFQGLVNFQSTGNLTNYPSASAGDAGQDVKGDRDRSYFTGEGCSTD